MLTGCRMLYTLEHGTIASKPSAAQWAGHALPPRWTPLIEWALAARREPGLKTRENLAEARELIRYVVERGGQLGNVQR